jgi:hypothetical protein
MGAGDGPSGLPLQYLRPIRDQTLEAPLERTPDLRALPRPTDEQYREFAEHIGEAHSWYKHLPLLTGGRFVVFLAPDAGIGRLVARLDGTGYQLVTPPDGPEFTQANPRLHYSWRTTAEYRRRFGYLDYARRKQEDSRFGRDVGGEMDLPPAIWERCTLTLFPYVSGSDPGRDSVRWAHQEAVERLRAGEAHPRREAVLEWVRLAQEKQEAWNGLTDAERGLVLAHGVGASTSPTSTATVERYRAAESALETHYEDQLRAGEVAKIRRALACLRAWLEER